MKHFLRNSIPVLAIALLNLSLLPTVQGELIWGVTSNNTLISWDSGAPQMLNSGTAISGLQVNEQIVGLDVRPLTGELFAIGNSSRLYTVNTSTGMASQVGSTFATTLSGSLFAYDFNPTIDRSRVVSDTRDNYVVNPNGGGITQVTDVFYPLGDANAGMAPNIAHLAYTNNFPGAVSSQLYGLDSGLDTLVTQANSAGTLGTVGSLGININGIGGFDISGVTGQAFASLMLAGSSTSNFYQINLATGATTNLGEIGGGNMITAMTVSAVPEPTAGLLSLAGLGMMMITGHRRRRVG